MNAFFVCQILLILGVGWGSRLPNRDGYADGHVPEILLNLLLTFQGLRQ